MLTNKSTFAMTLCPEFSSVKCQGVVDIWGKVASSKLDGIGHALSKIALHEAPKSCIQQSVNAGYTIYLMIHLSSSIEKRLYREVRA